jgi:hypothetical protein
MSDTATNIQNAVTIGSDLAVIASPIVSVYNPAAGAALALLAPVVSNFILTETQIILNLRTDMSKEDMIKALEASKSGTWNIKPLETV